MGYFSRESGFFPMRMAISDIFDTGRTCLFSRLVTFWKMEAIFAGVFNNFKQTAFPSFPTDT